jgi:phospholipid/cholesterol/gamma-HCH transport system ATP-binding protein
MSAPPPAVLLENVSMRTFRGLSCRASAGQLVRVMCAIHEQREELWDLLTAASSPRSGRAALAQRDLSALTKPERFALLQQIGTVVHDGGLISNLKAWENVVLPVWYHRGTEVVEIEKTVVGIFHDLGLDNDVVRDLMRRLPDQLNITERRWVAMARAMVMEPLIMIYDAPFTGVEREVATRMLKVMLEFHRARADRVSLFLLPDEPFSERVPTDITIALES